MRRLIGLQPQLDSADLEFLLEGRSHDRKIIRSAIDTVVQAYERAVAGLRKSRANPFDDELRLNSLQLLQEASVVPQIILEAPDVLVDAAEGKFEDVLDVAGVFEPPAEHIR